MLHAVFVGVGAQRDPRIPSARGARKNAEAMYASVSRSAAEQRHLTLLVDERATKQTIARVLTEELPARVATTDSVLIYFAGRLSLGRAGVQPGVSTYLVTHDTTHDDLRALSLDVIGEVAAWMRGMTARLVTLIVDSSFASSPTPRRWPAMTVHARSVILAASVDDDGVATESGRGLFTTHLLQAIARSPERGLVTPAQLHADTSASLLGGSARSDQLPVLIGAGSTTHAPLFRIREMSTAGTRG